MTSLDMKTWQRRMFRFTPLLLSISQQQKADMLVPFLAWAEQHKIPMDWTTHIHLLNWLKQSGWDIKLEIIQELLTAAVIRWSLNGLDHITAKGVIVASQHLPELGVGLWKNTKPDELPKMVHIHIPSHLQSPVDRYAISYVENSWKEVDWLVLAP